MLTQEWDMGKAMDTRFMEGREKGRTEGIIETALRMLSKGMNVEDISMLTGLSIEKINTLKQCH